MACARTWRLCIGHRQNNHISTSQAVFCSNMGSYGCRHPSFILCIYKGITHLSFQNMLNVCILIKLCDHTSCTSTGGYFKLLLGSNESWSFSCSFMSEIKSVHLFLSHICLCGILQLKPANLFQWCIGGIWLFSSFLYFVSLCLIFIYTETSDIKKCISLGHNLIFIWLDGI